MTSRELSAGYILRETLASCHCEPVTDVTGVAIRTNPPRVFHAFLGGEENLLGGKFCFARQIENTLSEENYARRAGDGVL